MPCSGSGCWVAVLQSGIHVTVAGVLLAFTIRPDPDRSGGAGHAGKAALTAFQWAGREGGTVLTNGAQQDALAELEDVVEAAGAPLQRFEHALHPWVAFAVLPLFALANAGVVIDAGVGEAVANRVDPRRRTRLAAWKQVGITLFSWLATRLGVTELPAGVSWGQIYGAGWLAGIGFTMALFVADLAFAGADETDLLTSAKLGILGASIVAGTVGAVMLARAGAQVARGRGAGEGRGWHRPGSGKSKAVTPSPIKERMLETVQNYIDARPRAACRCPFARAVNGRFDCEH